MKAASAGPDASGPTDMIDTFPHPAAPLPRILIVDDEAPARARMIDLLSDIAAEFPHTLIGEAASAGAALDRLAEVVADIALIDVEMPGMTGIELAQHLGALPEPPAIVFVTAFDEFAVKAFEVHALDYLMKPVRAARLLEALNRIGAIAARQKPAISAAARESGVARGRRRDTIAVVERGRVMLIPIADIVYLKAELKYITIRTVDREYLTEEPLVDLENEFADRFVRVHRNALVARGAIAGFERVESVESDSVGEPHWVVTLRDVKERLPVSRRQWPIVKEAMRT
ncbi:MAG: LytTR family DNA-binding domain-containing protein [Burkholderiaceae bacterium]